MEPTVTVVIPVYNALPYLTELLDSIAIQDVAPGSLNVMAVDDGSTDGSADVLDDYCRRHQNFNVIHQTNSGRPGGPRNVGLRASESSYVFFADADDRLAPECLRRLVTYAEAQGSDVVIPKMRPLGGRGFPTDVYENTLLDADLITAFRTLFPQKLYRRRLLTEHGIWFPEGRRLDDGIFNAQAYVHAKRISVLSDYDYYFLRARRDGRNLSRREREPVSYTSSVVELCRIVREHVKDPAIADQLVLDLYQRKCLHQYDPRRFNFYEAARQDAWIAAHKSFVERFISEAMERRLASPFRERSYFIRRGDRAGLLESSRHDAVPVVTAAITRAHWAGDGLEVAVTASVVGRVGLARQLICQLLRRDGDGASGFPISRSAADVPEYGCPAQYEGVLPYRSIQSLIEGAYDLHVVNVSGQERLSGRVRWGKDVAAPPERAGFRIHATKRGHVSIKKAHDANLDFRGALRRVGSRLGWRRSP
jgi:glycosyltransferase involved in cell wall biosynthesis